ncbi:MAG: DNA cytosine methyltransferase [Gammaproteobacteria bacterium]
MKSKAKVVSLFSGCGGSDSGLAALGDSGLAARGFEVVFANDILPYAKDLYLANFPETDYQCRDIREIKSKEFPAAELLVGCYPCQGFSQAGARVANRNINYLYREFERALRSIRPKAFIVENVSGLCRSDSARLLQKQLTCFGAAGYLVEHKLLNAVDFGVAQERRRIFIVGIRADLGIRSPYEFPKPTHGIGRKSPVKTIGDALAGFPEWPEGEFVNDKFHWYYMSRNRRRDWGEPSKTIVSKAQHVPIHPMSPKLRYVRTDVWEWSSDAPKRRFSYREAARLQGFQKNLIFPETKSGSLRNKYQVIGNAVPPPLFEAVAGALPDVW